MKLIKIKFFILTLLINLSTLQAEIKTIEGVKLNNEAVELLIQTLESMKAKSSEDDEQQEGQSYFDKLLNKFIGKDKQNQKQEMISQLKEKLKNIDKSKVSPDEINKLQAIIRKMEDEQGADSEVDEDKAHQEDKNELFNDLGMSKGLSEEQKKSVKINQEFAFQAYKRTLEATIKNEDLPEVRMNLGLAFELSGDLEKAAKAYAMAKKYAGEDLKLSFIASYNRARVLGGHKKIKEALAEYQKALEIDPKSKEVKTNIELLLTQNKGGGGGGGDQKDKDGKGDQKEPPPDAPPKENPKNNEYKPQNLSKKDVQKILEELKNQEQKIREKEYKKGDKEKPKDKDW